VFFLSIDNQLLFLMMTLFPTYLVFTALSWPSQDGDNRVHGIIFVSPLMLSLLSFLNAPVHHDTAEFLLLGGGISLSLLMVIAEFFHKKTNSSTMISLLALLSPVPFLIAMRRISLPGVKSLIIPVFAGTIVLMLLPLIIAIKDKKKSSIHRIAGGELIILGLLVFYLHLPWLPVYFSHILTAAGFVICSVSLYRTTFAGLRKKVNQYEGTLNQINANVQHEVIKRVESIEKSNKMLLERSKTDSLTGLYGKAAIISHAEILLERRRSDPHSLIMLDIDSFKTINDTMGHPIGDRCLVSLATIARSSFRSNDILGRFGGDEFTILLPNTPPSIALTTAERFRKNIEKESNPKYTISIGVATFPQDGESVKSLLESADKALYKSKESGKNRVTHFSVKNPNHS